MLCYLHTCYAILTGQDRTCAKHRQVSFFCGIVGNVLLKDFVKRTFTFTFQRSRVFHVYIKNHILVDVAPRVISLSWPLVWAAQIEHRCNLMCFAKKLLLTFSQCSSRAKIGHLDDIQGQIFEWSNFILIKNLILGRGAHTESGKVWVFVIRGWKTLPEAQRTQKLTLWHGLDLATTWHKLH